MRPRTLALLTIAAVISGCAVEEPIRSPRGVFDETQQRSTPNRSAQPGASGALGEPWGPGGPGGLGGPGDDATTYAIPDAVQVPAGARERLRTDAIGEVTYECRRGLVNRSEFGWSYVVPKANLFPVSQADAASQIKPVSGARNPSSGFATARPTGSPKPVAKLYAGPTWEGGDRSKVTGRQVAAAPSTPGSLALQLIKAEASTGTGVMKGVTYIQRLQTSGGLPSGPCDESLAGKRQTVPFEARYVFYGN